MNNKLILAAVAIVIIVAAGGFYFMNSNKSTSAPVSNQTAVPTSAPESGATTPSAVSGTEVTVEAEEFKFTPSEITVKKGEKVKLTFKNTGTVQHDYVISDLNVATKRIQPGEQETVEFTPEESGEFKFICSVGNHKEQGMVGTLTVE